MFARASRRSAPCRGSWRMAAMLVLMLVSGAWPGAALAEPRVALVIGNGSYAASRLKNPRADAVLMARSLSAAGFDVMTVMDASADQIRAAVSEFGTRLQAPGAVALFYYAGHGVQVDGDNYLIPLGVDIGTTEDVLEFAVPLQSVMRTMTRSATRLNIVILDACRDNPFAAGTWTASVTGLAPIVAPADTIIAYATGPGQMADDGAGANSPYTAALASEMSRPGATLEDVFRATRRHVLARTGNRQTPWEHSSLVSQFYFVPPPTPVAVMPAARADDSRVAELLEWDAIKATRDIALLQDHIRRYPGGLFAEVAAVRVAKIEAMRSGTPWSWMMTGGIDSSVRLTAATAIYEKAVALDRDGALADELALAVKLYAEAATEGLPAAMYRLGRAYDKGRGVSKDILEAARWFERAANANDAAAMAALGTMHEFGEGAAPNLAEALRLYQAAANAGDANGMASLAFLYSQGKGVARNTAEARRLYKAAADKGNARAMFNLGLMELRGEGAAANVPSAVNLLEAAAKLDHAGAMVELAHLFDRGRGVTRSSTRAAAYVLASLRVPRQAGQPQTGQGIDVAFGGWSYATRRQIQKQLAVKGLYAGRSHGFFNAETRKALMAVAER